MAEFNERITPDIQLQYLVENRLFEDEENFFIPSGVEFCWKNVVNYGKGRIDGKLIVASLTNDGTLKVVGTLETEPLFE